MISEFEVLLMIGAIFGGFALLSYFVGKAITSNNNRSSEKESSYIKSGWTRHDAFSQILHENPPRTKYRDGDIVVLNVKFNSYGHTYCHRAKDDVCNVRTDGFGF